MIGPLVQPRSHQSDGVVGAAPCKHLPCLTERSSG